MLSRNLGGKALVLHAQIAGIGEEKHVLAQSGWILLEDGEVLIVGRPRYSVRARIKNGHGREARRRNACVDEGDSNLVVAPVQLDAREKVKRQGNACTHIEFVRVRPMKGGGDARV